MSAPVCAADLVNDWPEEELARIFYEYGDEKASRRVAKAIVRRRAERAFETTCDLAAVVATVIPKRGPASPATRVFQALRIAVNNEMGALETALEAAQNPPWRTDDGIKHPAFCLWDPDSRTLKTVRQSPAIQKLPSCESTHLR